MAARLVWDQEVAGSNPATPTGVAVSGLRPACFFRNTGPFHRGNRPRETGLQKLFTMFGHSAIAFRRSCPVRKDFQLDLLLFYSENAKPQTSGHNQADYKT